MASTKLLKHLLALVGKNYDPAPELPMRLWFGTVLTRAYWLMRGLVRFRRRAFVGPGVKVRGAGGLKLGRYASLEEGCRVDGYARSGVRLGARSKLGAYTIVSCTSHLSKYGIGLVIGDDCGVSEFCYFGASGGIVLGNNVIIGQYVSFHSENHNFDDPSRPIREQGVTSEGIIIGHDVWIGAKATILDGSEIGDHSVIAAGAVVRGKFPPGSLIGGVPARVLRSLEQAG